MSDRRVHACNEHIEIVRYEGTGKWYVESRRNSLTPTERLTVRQAAKIARGMTRGTIYLGLPGGRVFDRLVRASS